MAVSFLVFVFACNRFILTSESSAKPPAKKKKKKGSFGESFAG